MKKIFLATAFMLVLVVSAFSASAQTQSRDDLFNEIQSRRNELVSLEKKFLEPSNADREANAAFLAEPKTGIIRLLPREKYDSNDSFKRVLTIRGGGAFYSFGLSEHEYGYGSDIMLSQGDFSGGFGGADYGMLLNLGDVPLEQVNSEHSAVRALLEYMPTSSEPDARKAQRALWQGMDLSGVIFTKVVPAKVSNTYLVRSVNFGGYDIAVAFRAIRKDTDGSFILLFKELKRFPKPDLERPQTGAQ